VNLVGERLREARLARGLTQEQLARGLATKGFICQIERNRATPSLAKLRVMAERLGLPLSHFTGDQAARELNYLGKAAELAVRAAEPRRALALVDEGLGLAGTANERADLLRIRGLALEALGQLSEALVAQQTAAATAPPDDPELNARIYVEMGTILQSGERFNAAIEANLRALSWLDRCRHADPAMRSRILHNLGREYYGLGELAEADTYFKRALAAGTDAESVFRIANAHMSLGVSARAIGELDRAVEHCNRALELLERQGQERFANRVLNNLGDVHFASGRIGEARRLQQRCLERAREINDALEIGIAAGALARYAFETGDIEDCIKLARESQAAARQSGDRLHEAVSMALEARAAHRQGHGMVADRKFRHALRILARREAGAKLAEVCALYADVLRERGDVDRAFAFMRMAADRDFGGLSRLLRQTAP